MTIGNSAASKQPATSIAYGAVEGRAQTAPGRAGLPFTPYNKTFNSAVSCYVEPGKEALMRDIWGKRVAVQGRVTRDSATGRPLSVRQISAIDPIPLDRPVGYRWQNTGLSHLLLRRRSTATHATSYRDR